MRLFNTLLFFFVILASGQVLALDYEVIDTANEDGSPLVIDNIKILSVHRLFTTTVNGHDMVELSGLAWSEDEKILYAISDHGVLFHFKPVFGDNGLSDITMLGAYPLRDAARKPTGYPWSDSEGLYLQNGNNGKTGDDELLVSFELKPRLQWHKPDGGYLRKEPLPAWMEDKSSYYRRTKALESVTIHPEYGVITTPEYPMENADWSQLVLYRSNGVELTVERDAQDDMAVCALETMPDGDLMMLERRQKLLAPTWTTRLVRLSVKQGLPVERKEIASMTVGDRMPVDNYEGLTRHTGKRYFMVSDNNEYFMQKTLLVYFELLP